MEARVYRNLVTGLWSIQQRVGKDWRVVGHASSCTLRDVSVWVGKSGQNKAKADKVRNVHLMAVGELVAVSAGASFKDRTPTATGGDCPAMGSTTRGITYNPFIHNSLVHRDDSTPYNGSDWAMFGVDQKMYAQ